MMTITSTKLTELDAYGDPTEVEKDFGISMDAVHVRLHLGTIGENETPVLHIERHAHGWSIEVQAEGVCSSMTTESRGSCCFAESQHMDTQKLILCCLAIPSASLIRSAKGNDETSS